MNVFDYLNNAQLVRAINSTKDYVLIDTEDSINHFAGKVKFTDTIDPKIWTGEGIYMVELACSQDALHYACKNLLDCIARQWKFNCYHYESFELFLRRSFEISEWQYQTLKRFCEE